MANKRDDRASRPDAENPEWTPEDFRAARPALDMIAEAFGPQAAEAVRRGRGRPEKPDRKVNQTLRLDPDVIEAYRRQGSGWQTRINEVLRAHMPRPERPGPVRAVRSRWDRSRGGSATGNEVDLVSTRDQPMTTGGLHRRWR